MPNKGYKQTKEHKEKIRQSNIGKQAGEKHPNWKDGIKVKDVNKYRREQGKRLYQLNPEKFRARKRLEYSKNPEKARVRGERYRQKNFEKVRFNIKQYKIRKRNAEGSHTLGEWELLKKQYGFTCPACGKKEPEIQLTEDHIIPLIKGGSNYIENIQPLCRSCNNKKHTKIIYYSFFAEDE